MAVTRRPPFNTHSRLSSYQMNSPGAVRKNGMVSHRRSLKVRRIAGVLREHLGTPRRSSPPPPLDMLIATILSQNTRDTNSYRAYRSLRQRYPSWKDVAEASRRNIASAIRGGGMAYQKSGHIKGALTQVYRTYHSYDLRGLSRKPTHAVLEELTRIRGVGVKTAACVLLFSLRRGVFPVDTHVHRLCGRLGLVNGSRTPEQTFWVMAPAVPPPLAHSLHTNLIRFGRSICTAQNPRCGICPLFRECVYPLKQRRGAVFPNGSNRTRDFMLLDSVGRSTG